MLLLLLRSEDGRVCSLSQLVLHRLGGIIRISSGTSSSRGVMLLTCNSFSDRTIIHFVSVEVVFTAFALDVCTT